MGYLSGHGNALCGFIVEKGDFNWGKEPGKFPILASPCDAYHGMNFNDTFGKDGPVAEMFGTKGQTGISFCVTARTLGLRDCGPCLSPFNAFLVSMGMETLPLRMDRHVFNAQKVAEFLHSHPMVAWVNYSATKYLSGHGNALCGFIVEKGDFNWSKEPGKFPILARSPSDRG